MEGKITGPKGIIKWENYCFKRCTVDGNFEGMRSRGDVDGEERIVQRLASRWVGLHELRRLGHLESC